MQTAEKGIVDHVVPEVEPVANQGSGGAVMPESDKLGTRFIAFSEITPLDGHVSAGMIVSVLGEDRRIGVVGGNGTGGRGFKLDRFACQHAVGREGPVDLFFEVIGRRGRAE